MKKHDYDKILYRLTTIWSRLREGETLSVKELATEFNVSTKTIQRDFNERLADKMPIQKVGHRWKVMDGYSIDKNLSFEEDLILDILKEISTSMGTSFSSQASTLFSKIQNNHQNPIYSKIEIEDISNKIFIIKQLQEAIENSLQVEFNYKKKYRFIKPYKITTFDGYWYLYGEDILDMKLKTFYIKDIVQLTVSTNSFIKDTQATRNLENAINIWFEPNSKPFEVKLLAKPQIAKYFERRALSNTQKIIEIKDDKSIVLSLFATSEQEIITEVKKWFPHLLVISPIYIAKKLRDESMKFQQEQMDLLL